MNTEFLFNIQFNPTYCQYNLKTLSLTKHISYNVKDKVKQIVICLRNKIKDNIEKYNEFKLYMINFSIENEYYVYIYPDKGSCK